MTPEMTVRGEVRLTREEYLAWRDRVDGALLTHKLKNLSEMVEREVREQAKRCGWDADQRRTA